MYWGFADFLQTWRLKRSERSENFRFKTSLRSHKSCISYDKDSFFFEVGFIMMRTRPIKLIPTIIPLSGNMQSQFCPLSLTVAIFKKPALVCALHGLQFLPGHPHLLQCGMQVESASPWNSTGFRGTVALPWSAPWAAGNLHSSTWSTPSPPSALTWVSAGLFHIF